MFRFLLILTFLCPFILYAQKLPTIEQKTSGMKRLEGYFTLYRDAAEGKLWMAVKAMDSSFLYVTSLPAGLGSNDIGLDRGLLGNTRVVKFNRVGKKLMMVQLNYRYRALSGDLAEARAAEESFAQSTIWGFKIEAESNGSVLVDLTDFLTRDALGAANRIRDLKQGNYTLDSNRSALYLPHTKNFPFNTEMEASVTLVSTDGQAGEFIRTVAPGTDAITLRMHHSFVQLPDKDYTPRIYDPRSSFISTAYFDYSTPVYEPIEKLLVIRHRLKKKNPSAAKSEAIKPIIYYLDNGTPEPIRSALLQGARWWNEAFEAAGFINAFQVKVLPDDADPMDIRYNMINWVHRSTRGWSYGASVVDPRTGEIIKGNVTLGSLRVRQDYLIAQGLLSPFENGMPADNKMMKMALARLSQLAAHEVGHTLGLMHNFASSVSGRASVMDYPHPTVHLTNEGTIDLSDAYASGIGEWDKVSISWGYSEFNNKSNEDKSLDKILSDAEKKGLLFISDDDARPRGGMHPYAHLWDNGKDPVNELKDVLAIRKKALEQFGQNSIREETPMAFLEDVLVPVYLYHRYQTEAVSKMIGGMNYSYALKGDGQVVMAPVSKTEQAKALDALLQTIDPQVLVLPEKVLTLIPPRPDGYVSSRELFRKRTAPAFDALTPAETATDLTIGLLFTPERMNRLTEFSVLYGGLSLEEMLGKLMEKTWKAPRRSGMEELIQIQTEQILLTWMLSSSVDENLSFNSRSVVVKSLADLKAWIENQKNTASGNYAGHLLLALERMKAPDKSRPASHAAIPPGAPIGCCGD